jgi:hypothetical protein
MTTNERKFFQRLRSLEAPQDPNRVAHTGIPVSKLVTEPVLSEEDKAAITRKFMNTPVYPGRVRGNHLRASRKVKLLPHPMRSAE